MINTYSTIDQSVEDIGTARDVYNKPTDRGYANFLVRLGSAAILAASSIALTSCNPIDIYKTIEIRHKESDMYEKYKQIDMNKLTAAEKDYLARMHQKYGEGPIDSTKLTDKMSKTWIKNFNYITGHKKFTDKDLIFIHRSSDDLVGAILGTIAQQK